MAKEFKLSAERLEELKQELNYLKTVREKEVADQIKEARSFGDLSENSEYDEAKNEQGKLYSRMRPTPIPSAWAPRSRYWIWSSRRRRATRWWAPRRPTP